MTTNGMSRRAMVTCACCGAAAALLPGAWLACAAAEQAAPPGMTPDEALRLLQEGNELFVADRLPPPQHGPRRLELARSQRPFAVLVGCSDSRVPPEILFGRGLGELFIIRNAGNTVDVTAQGSIEYAVGELGVPLIVVLGHERCGAVAAAVEVVERSATFPGRIGQMVEPIIPAVLRARHDAGAGLSQDELLDAAVRENVRRVVRGLGLSELLSERQRAGRLRIVGARYDLDDGRVEFFTES